MKPTDRTILLIIPALALLIGFWVLVVAPKQSAAGDLQNTIDDLQASLTTAQSQKAAGEAAEKSFHRNYADVVSLGAAAPSDSDQATLVYEMSKLGEKNHVSFRSFEVTQDAGAATAAPTTPAPTTPAPTTPAPTTEAPTTATPTAIGATPTEATVAALPLGATVGPAGLPLIPYDFNFFGNFFNIADFFGDIDNQVTVTDDGKGPVVRGRLLTIDGFALTEKPGKGFPAVQADFAVTTYVVPPEQGVDAGASPAGPSATTTPDTTVTSTPAPTTATVTP
jgi:hypothetical protein